MTIFGEPGHWNISVGSTSCKQMCNFVGYNSTILGHLLHQAAILFTKESHRNDNKLISVNSH